MAKTTWLLCLCILLSTLQNARAQTYSLKAEPSADALTITFPKKAPQPQVLRTGPKQVELLFPAGTTLAPVPAAFGKGRHIMGVGVADNVLVVQVAEDAFGFIASPKGDKALSLQVYYDPAGTRWQPSGPQSDAPKSGEAPAASAPAAQAQTPPASAGTAQTPPDQAGATPTASRSAVRASIAPGATASPASAPVPGASQSAVATGSIEPAKPASSARKGALQPVAPVTPAPSAAPVAPITPVTPSAPVVSVQSPSSVKSGLLQPVAPVTPAPSAAPVAPIAPVAPAAPVASVQPVASVSPATPAASVPPVVAPSAVPAPPAPAKPVAAVQPSGASPGGAPQSPVQGSPKASSSVRASLGAPPAASPIAGQPAVADQAGTSPPQPGATSTVAPGQPAPATAPPGSGQPAAGKKVAGKIVAAAKNAGKTPPPPQPVAEQPASAASGPAPTDSGGPVPAPTVTEAPNKPSKGASEVRGSIFEPITEAQKNQAAKPGELSAPATPVAPVTPTPPAGKAVGGAITPPSASQPAGQPEPVKAETAGQPGTPEGTPAAAAPEEAKPPTMVGDDSLEDTAQLINAQRNQENGKYDKAIPVYDVLLAKPTVSPAMREEILYNKAEALFDMHRDALPEHFSEVNDNLQRALNFNTKSMRIPRALIYLGYLNLRMGNLPEAKAYFNLLKNKYPMDESVPLVDIYWGQYFMEQAKEHDPKGNYGKAAEAFKSVLQNNPESKWAKEASLGLAKSLLELKQYVEAGKIIEYIDKRWPRYYVDNPSMRRISGDIAFKLGDFQRAKDEYLWFYNLLPNDQSADMVLSRLGDVNARLGKMDAAREYYDMTIRLHPGTDGALISMMRLAEQGVFDTPTMQEMTKAFASPKDVKPDQIYQYIVKDFPNSPMAPLAQLKLAMWQLYKKDYLDSLESIGTLMSKYPGNEVEKQAIEVAGQAFAKLMPGLMADMNYKRIYELWRKYPYLAANPDLLPHKERLGVALALYYAGFPRDALAMAEPYLAQGPNDNSQKALALCLTIYRENQDWQAILSTLKQVGDWKLAENPRRTLEFAQAMALEHTGDFAKSRLLWARLMNDPQLEPAKKGYAMYYQARTAMERQDYEKALAWAMDARTLFEEAAKDTGKVQDATMLIIEANQKLGRFPQALQWCDVYAKGITEGSPEWAANRFRMATIQRQGGNFDAWRSIMENLRDTSGDSLYGKMAATDLTAWALEERAGKLTSTK